MEGIENTKKMLENYKSMQEFVQKARSESRDIDNAELYTISAENAYIGTIRYCKAETIIMLQNIDTALELLRQEACGKKMEREYRAFIMRYAEGMTYEEIQEALDCSKNTPKRWCDKMLEMLAPKLFGVRGVMDDEKMSGENVGISWGGNG